MAGLPGVLDDLTARATRRDPGARPTDAGALLAVVQVVRDDLGSANIETAVYRQVARPTERLSPHSGDETAIVPAVPETADHRPTWARLPQSQPRARGTRRRMEEQEDDGAAARRTRLLMIIAASVITLVLAGGGWWIGVGRYGEAPRLVNLPKTQAVAAARQEGFELTYAEAAYSEEVAKDVVMSQDPPVGTKLVKGGTITLVLSLGKERHKLPDVTGMDISAAKAQLENTKLRVKEGEKQYSDLPAGVVLSLDPKAGTELKPGDTVTLVVSKGKAPITMPNVVGKNVNDARAELQALKLTVLEQLKDSSEPAGEVLAQTPTEGSGVDKDAEVKLEISKGPPFVVMPRVVDQPCQQAKAALESMGLKVRVDFFGNATARSQSPAEGTQIPPQTEVNIQCF